MSSAPRLVVLSVLATLLLGAESGSRPVFAQGDPRIEIRSNLAFAEENFDRGDHQAAQASLVQALARLSSAKLSDDPLAARVHMFLAILYLGPLDQVDTGHRHMQQALAIDPDAELDRERASEQAADLFEELTAAQDRSEASSHRVAIERDGGTDSQPAGPGPGSSEESEMPPVAGERPKPRGSTCGGCAAGTGAGSAALVWLLGIGLIRRGSKPVRP